MSTSSIALNRFGVGARPDEPVPKDAKRWLVAQFSSFEIKPSSISEAPSSADVARQLADYYAERRDLREKRKVAAEVMHLEDAEDQPDKDPIRKARKLASHEARQNYAISLAARTNAALVTEAPFVERLVHFWANHFTVSADRLDTMGLAGSLEFEAIRPNVLGRFADMLHAVERHPAMLLYLDQAVSVGPSSEVGQRAARRRKRQVGLNENFAREIMELHTLGVRTGYTQADVTELARALTGWTVSGISRGPGAKAAGQEVAPGSFFFAASAHEPGARLILGKHYPETGVRQGQQILSDLATSAATARHLASKLARHFAGDTPPQPMVDRLSEAYLSSGGDLPTVYEAIVASPEAWTAAPVKFKTPWEWTVSCYRAIGQTQVGPRAIAGMMRQLGQPVWKPGQPVGYEDTAGKWAGPYAIMRRVQAAESLASRAPEADARELAVQLFPGGLSASTAESLARAESPAQALALLLVSPEMMRR